MDETNRRVRASRFPNTLLLVGGILALVLTLFFVAACGDGNNDDGNTNGAPQPTESGSTDGDISGLTGRIRIDGSSTVGPISAAVAEEFMKVTDTTVDVAISGTSGGFEAFCRGEIQVSDASRPIKDEERQACADGGITDVIEFQIAIDALTVIVNPDNDFVDCMTVAELAKAFSTDGATTWSDIRPEWPDDKITFYVPGTDSGTFDYFTEAIIAATDENGTHRGDVTASEDDNVLVQGIEGDANSIGYFGYAYYQEAGQGLKAVAVDNGAGCVEPSTETALDGSYAPLSRPLFIYTRESFLRDKPEVREFVRYYLDNSTTLVPEVGFITETDDTLQQQQAKLAPFLQ
ncbi:MAG: PstS family phosphate ABC transporter substrate-binding protein [Dehalococcoidia bacterium]